MVGGDLESSVRLGSVPGERTPRLCPATVRVVAGSEGPAVTETPVLYTLGGTARHHRVRVGAQPDHVVRDALQLKPGIPLVRHRANTGLLRWKRRNILMMIAIKMDPKHNYYCGQMRLFPRLL